MFFFVDIYVKEYIQGGVYMRINSISTNAMSTQDARNAQKPVEAVSSEGIVYFNNQKRADVELDEVIDDAMLVNSVKEANKNLALYNRKIERSVHEVTHTIMYVVKDTLTNEVITEFPSRKIQDMIAKMWEMAGILVDERR